MLHRLIAAAAVLVGSIASGQCLRVADSPGQEVPGPHGNSSCAQHWDPDGSGPLPSVLVVGGRFDVAGTSICRNICYWDGQSWNALGAGFNDTVTALALFNGELYAGGEFTASGATACSRVARWNPAAQQWQAVGAGAGGVNGDVTALGVHSGRLYVGGQFTSAGGLPASGIASWTGSAWGALGSGLAGSGGPSLPNARCMASFNGELYVGGYFQTAGGLSSPGFAKWTGSSWVALGADDEVVCLNAWQHYSFPQARLYVGGRFNTIAGTANPRLATFDGTAWSSVPMPAETYGVMALNIGSTPIGADVFTVLWGPAISGIYRYAWGSWSLVAPSPGLGTNLTFYNSEPVVCAGAVSRWDGLRWRPFGNGLNSTVFDSAVYNGSLYLGGAFGFADQQEISALARFDGTTFHPVGAGVSGTVLSLAVHNNSLIIAGSLSSAGGIAVTGTARWNGSAWSAMPGAPSYVTALLASGGQLYLAGSTSSTGGVFRWNGASWVRIGQPLYNTPTFVIEHAGSLYTSAALTPGGLMVTLRLDGTTWVDVGPPLRSLAASSEGMVGIETSQGIYRVHAFTNGAWSEILPWTLGFSWGVYSVDGQVYADLNGTLCRWVPPADWEPVFDSNNSVMSLRRHGQNLIATGGFSEVDGVARGRWAVLSPCCGSADFDGDGDLGTDADIEAFFACLAGSCCPACSADFDYDGDLGTDADIEAFFRVLGGGNC